MHEKLFGGALLKLFPPKLYYVLHYKHTSSNIVYIIIKVHFKRSDGADGE